MQKQIWKYELPLRFTCVSMSEGSIIRHVDSQNGIICLWVEVELGTNKKHITRTFEIFGTGHAIPCDVGIERSFIGTVKIDGEKFMFHVYERIQQMTEKLIDWLTVKVNDSLESKSGFTYWIIKTFTIYD